MKGKVNEMTQKLYLECNSGISGDMTVAALLDLGADQNILMDALHSIPVEGFSIEIKRVKKSGIDCCDFSVHLDQMHENHDHDMAYLHGHQSEHHSLLEANSFHNHCADHKDHSENHVHEHHHEHRGLKEIRDIIHSCKLSDSAKAIALKIFEILAEAEAKAHGVTIDEVHFHEVGAIDSIVDIIAVAVCIDNLNIKEVIVPNLCEGHGTVRCQHGILPIPVPAVSNILEAYKIPVTFIAAEGEFVTPTGAAIIAALKTSEKLPETCIIKKIGIGAGKRTYERPSILRAMLLEEECSELFDTIYKLESNIDDCTGEALGYVMEQLLEAGAKDVHYMPVYMKKNRPAWQLNVICSEEDIIKLEHIIFAETTTIGIRRQKMERTILKRDIIFIQTIWGEAKVKVCQIDSEKRYYPEYESIVAICRKENLSYQEVYHQIINHCMQ